MTTAVGNVGEVAPPSTSTPATAHPSTGTARPSLTVPVPLVELLGESRRGEDSLQPGTLVSGVTLDSRLVRPGDLYVALPGRSHHGARFAAGAVRSGAVAVLTDAEGALLAADVACPVITVADPRVSMAAVAARVYGRPSEAMAMFAVTGTNGKTTTTYLLDAALRSAGRHVGVIGTIGFVLDGIPLETARTTVTTPESPELQALLAVMSEGGADSCLMEVSSHALVLHRADAIDFDVAAFTNFGRDHLDFHGDEESYFEAKASLFTRAHTRHAVINVDDPRGRLLVDRITAAGEIGVSTLSLTPGAADYAAVSVELSAGGITHVRLACPERELEFDLALPGEFNVRNAVTAIAMLDVVGVDLDAAVVGLAAAQVPGRMQRVDLGPDAPTVFVDFAHTAQAVTAALGALEGQRRLVVLGSGGDRDPDKREPMGAAAARSAEVVVVTDDNPRTEVPEAIRARVLDGARAAAAEDDLDVVVLDGGDRRTAIRTALARADVGDVVAVLGKGHEPGQEIAGQVLPFSDLDVIVEEWAALQTRTAS